MQIEELGISFDSSLLDQFIVLNQEGYSAQRVQEIMNLPQEVFSAVVQAYFGEIPF
jgi:hypothetical protein